MGTSSSQAEVRTFSHLSPVALALFALAVVLAITLALGVRRSANRVVYGTDDIYIHLSIARNLANDGVWGINRGEFAGASSSPLWTVLLSLGMRVGGPAVWLPLVLGCLSAGLAIIGGWRLLRRFMSDSWAAALALLIMMAAGFPLLVMGGMEHSLQIAMTFFFLLLCARVLDFEKPAGPRLLTAVFCCAVLLMATRFEGLFFVAAACLLSLLNRQWLASLAIAVGGWMGELSLRVRSFSRSHLPADVTVENAP